MTRRRVAVFAFAFAAQAAALVMIAEFAASVGRTLDRDGRWESTKIELRVMGGREYMATRATLRYGRLDLGRWQGFHELWTKERFAGLREVSFHAKLGDNAHLLFLFERDEATIQGVRLSVNPQFPSLFFRARTSGEFLETRPVEAPDLPTHRWIRIRAVLEPQSAGTRLRLEVDGEPLGAARLAGTADAARSFGFRGSYRHAYVDNIVARHAGGVWEECFSDDSTFPAALAIGAAVLGVLNLLGWRLLRRRNVARPGFALLTESLVLLFAVGLFFWVDLRWISKSYACPDETPIEERLQRHARKVKARVAQRLATKSKAATVRVLFLGSSQTWGEGALRREEGFVPMVARLLNEDRPAFECINGGIKGSRAPWLLDVYREAWLDLKPDVLVVHLSSNDPDERVFAESLAEIVRLSQAQGIRVLFSLEANTEERRPGVLELHSAMRAVAARHGVPVADPHAYLREQRHRGLLWWDFVHPTSFGHALIAECLAPRVRQVAEGVAR